MHFLAQAILPLLTLTAVATAGISAEAPPAAAPASSPADLSSIYNQVAVAKAKAELSIRAMKQDVDSRQNGIEAARGIIESCREKASSKYESLRQAEESRGEMKDEVFLAACSAALEKLDADNRESSDVRTELDIRLQHAQMLSEKMFDAYESAENIERSFKDAVVDLAVILQLFTLIESKAAEASKEAKAVAAAYAVLPKPWQDALSTADSFSK